nr:MAG TPA: hypothetical protein [Caudoviricetes sp.]
MINVSTIRLIIYLINCFIINYPFIYILIIELSSNVIL